MGLEPTIPRLVPLPLGHTLQLVPPFCCILMDRDSGILSNFEPSPHIPMEPPSGIEPEPPEYKTGSLPQSYDGVVGWPGIEPGFGDLQSPALTT